MLDRDHADQALPVYQEFITAENVNFVFSKYRVPQSFDLLSVDIDGNDYWVWNALARAYRPRIVVLEFNAAVPLDVSVTMPYDPSFRWSGQGNIGMSLLALQQLAARKGYSLVYAQPPAAYLVLRSLLPKEYRSSSVRDVLRVTGAQVHSGQLLRWNLELRALPWVRV